MQMGPSFPRRGCTRAHLAFLIQKLRMQRVRRVQATTATCFESRLVSVGRRFCDTNMHALSEIKSVDVVIPPQLLKVQPTPSITQCAHVPACIWERRFTEYSICPQSMSWC